MTEPADFYTGLIADAYAPLRGEIADPHVYERFVRRYGEPALEIGCGHGEPLLDLVANGLEVVGLDSSRDMLERCDRAAVSRGLSVELHCQRMEELSIDRAFRSIYFAGPTFQLVIDEVLAQQTLDRIALHLASNGRVLLPLFVPTQADPSTFGVWKEHRKPGGECLAVTTLDQVYRLSECRVDTVLRYRRGPAEDPIEVVDRQWSLRWYPPEVFEAMTTRAGLAIDREVHLGNSARACTLRRASEQVGTT